MQHSTPRCLTPYAPLLASQRTFIQYLDISHDVADDRLAEVLPLYTDIRAAFRWSELHLC